MSSRCPAPQPCPALDASRPRLHRGLVSTCNHTCLINGQVCFVDAAGPSAWLLSFRRGRASGAHVGRRAARTEEPRPRPRGHVRRAASEHRQDAPQLVAARRAVWREVVAGGGEAARTAGRWRGAGDARVRGRWGRESERLRAGARRLVRALSRASARAQARWRALCKAAASGSDSDS